MFAHLKAVFSSLVNSTTSADTFRGISSQSANQKTSDESEVSSFRLVVLAHKPYIIP